MNEDNHPYTRAELSPGGNGVPERGPLCEHCQTRIPQFAELDEAAAADICRLIDERSGGLAIAELMRKTDCSLDWAKIWVLHRGQPIPKFPGPPCPYCGLALRTSRARQCPHCFRSWHGAGAK